MTQTFQKINEHHVYLGSELGNEPSDERLKVLLTIREVITNAQTFGAKHVVAFRMEFENDIYWCIATDAEPFQSAKAIQDNGLTVYASENRGQSIRGAGLLASAASMHPDYQIIIASNTKDDGWRAMGAKRQGGDHLISEYADVPRHLKATIKNFKDYSVFVMVKTKKTTGVKTEVALAPKDITSLMHICGDTTGLDIVVLDKTGVLQYGGKADLLREIGNASKRLDTIKVMREQLSSKDFVLSFETEFENESLNQTAVFKGAVRVYCFPGFYGTAHERYLQIRGDNRWQVCSKAFFEGSAQKLFLRLPVLSALPRHERLGHNAVFCSPSYADLFRSCGVRCEESTSRNPVEYDDAEVWVSDFQDVPSHKRRPFVMVEIIIDSIHQNGKELDLNHAKHLISFLSDLFYLTDARRVRPLIRNIFKSLHFTEEMRSYFARLFPVPENRECLGMPRFNERLKKKNLIQLFSFDKKLGIKGAQLTRLDPNGSRQWRVTICRANGEPVYANALSCISNRGYQLTPEGVSPDGMPFYRLQMDCLEDTFTGDQLVVEKKHDGDVVYDRNNKSHMPRPEFRVSYMSETYGLARLLLPRTAVQDPKELGNSETKGKADCEMRDYLLKERIDFIGWYDGTKLMLNENNPTVILLWLQPAVSVSNINPMYDTQIKELYMEAQMILRHAVHEPFDTQDLGYNPLTTYSRSFANDNDESARKFLCNRVLQMFFEQKHVVAIINAVDREYQKIQAQEQNPVEEVLQLV